MESQIFRTRQPLNWAAITNVYGDDIPVGRSGNVLGTTALTPPVLAAGGPIMTNTVEAEAPKPVDIHQMMDDMNAFRAAQAEAQQRCVEAAMKTVVDLSERGQDEQAFAILRSLFRPEPLWERWIGPTCGRPS